VSGCTVASTSTRTGRVRRMERREVRQRGRATAGTRSTRPSSSTGAPPRGPDAIIGGIPDGLGGRGRRAPRSPDDGGPLPWRPTHGPVEGPCRARGAPGPPGARTRFELMTIRPAPRGRRAGRLRDLVSWSSTRCPVGCDEERTCAGGDGRVPARCNVVCKLSGLAMPLETLGVDASALARVRIEVFGVDRCLFASNFPWTRCTARRSALRGVRRGDGRPRRRLAREALRRERRARLPLLTVRPRPPARRARTPDTACRLETPPCHRCLRKHGATGGLRRLRLRPGACRAQRRPPPRRRGSHRFVAVTTRPPPTAASFTPGEGGCILGRAACSVAARRSPLPTTRVVPPGALPRTLVRVVA